MLRRRCFSISGCVNGVPLRTDDVQEERGQQSRSIVCSVLITASSTRLPR
jgi:hypothetical protein